MSRDYIGIFQQAWWLELSSGGKLEQLQVNGHGGASALFQFVRKRKWGLTLLLSPPHTFTLDPLLTLPTSKPAKALRNKNSVMDLLISSLPHHDLCHFVLPHNSDLAFSLALAGCSLAQRFTFRLPAPYDSQFFSTDIPQAMQEDDEIAAIEICNEAEQGHDRLTSGLSCGTRAFLALAAQARQQGGTLLARGKDRSILAAVSIIWDVAVLYVFEVSALFNDKDRIVLTDLLRKAMSLAREKQLVFELDCSLLGLPVSMAEALGLVAVTQTMVFHLSKRGKRVQAAGRLVGIDDLLR